jgi:hypothetical protein
MPHRQGRGIPTVGRRIIKRAGRIGKAKMCLPGLRSTGPMTLPASPLFSIVLPVLNRAAMLGSALGSLVGQAAPGEMECLVIDGGSTDGSQDIAGSFPFVKLVSEPDQGLYDAINKGIGLAGGSLIGLLNSDDLFTPDSLGQIRNAFATADVDSVCGGAEEVAVDDVGSVRLIRRWTDPDIRQLSWDCICSGAPIINARFFRRTWFETSGLFDTRWRIAADREFLLRSRLLGLRTRIIEPVVYRYRVHPGSLTFRPEGRVSAATLLEYRAIALEALRSADAHPGTDPALTAALRRWLSRDTLLLLSHQIRQRHWAAIGDSLGLAFRHDSLWPLRSFGLAMSRLRSAAGSGQPAARP